MLGGLGTRHQGVLPLRKADTACTRSGLQQQPQTNLTNFQWRQAADGKRSTTAARPGVRKEGGLGPAVAGGTQARALWAAQPPPQPILCVY